MALKIKGEKNCIRISLNGTNVQASTNSQSRINKSIEMDSVSKSINNQIANAQKQLQENVYGFCQFP